MARTRAHLHCRVKKLCAYGDQGIPGAYSWVEAEYFSPPVTQTSSSYLPKCFWNKR